MKRLFDVALSVLILPVVLPPMLLITLLIRATMGKPVLFRQPRAGWRGRPFVMLKFRTMREAATAAGQPLPDADRLTRLGRFLRASSLDELPELWNVLKGDMSLVGPRPLLLEYLPLYDATQARRHQVRPGITGWAQVNGRNALTWKKKFDLDVWYIDHRSFWLDLKILWLTLIKVARGDGISQEGQATATAFKGNP